MDRDHGKNSWHLEQDLTVNCFAYRRRIKKMIFRDLIFISEETWSSLYSGNKHLRSLRSLLEAHKMVYRTHKAP